MRVLFTLLLLQAGSIHYSADRVHIRLWTGPGWSVPTRHVLPMFAGPEQADGAVNDYAVSVEFHNAGVTSIPDAWMRISLSKNLKLVTFGDDALDDRHPHMFSTMIEGTPPNGTGWSEAVGVYPLKPGPASIHISLYENPLSRSTFMGKSAWTGRVVAP